MSYSKEIKRLCILQINTNDIKGGAAKSTWALFRNYRDRGLHSWLAVGNKTSKDENVLYIRNDKNRSIIYKFLNVINKVGYKHHGRRRLYELSSEMVQLIAEPKRSYEIRKGMEDFYFPGTKDLLHICPQRPDVIHCRNLHGGYFDLRELPYISRKIPTVITLADAWLLSGHCAHSLECDKWLTGCGDCPDLSRYPSIRKDMTRKNWLRKQQIYRQSKYYVTSAAEWMINKVKNSILMEGAVDARVIPNGIDLSCFKPGEKESVRRDLNIPSRAIVLLFAATGIKKNIYKNYSLLRKALEILDCQKFTDKLHFVALGDMEEPENLERIDLNFIPYQTEPDIVAKYYQAADIYLHAAKAEVWGLTVTEALACGIPVVATDVGGIKEQIINGITGFLTSPTDPTDMAEKIKYLIDHPDKRKYMGIQACKYAKTKFDVHRMVDDYLNLYREVLNRE
jgi:glycosyltransferase involved in cell wall biosynthesis